MLKTIFLRFFVIFFIFFPTTFVYGASWQELKGKHFVVYYTFQQDTPIARKVLRKAEGYYDTIGKKIGYSRYSDFWTWEDRAKIIIFPNKESFMRNTGQPAWSLGYSARDSHLFKSRIIVTYRLENNFLDGLLPHEISHLVLRDFIGFDRHIPVWFDEGVAQLCEKNKLRKADRLMRRLVKKKQYIPLNILSKWDIRKEKDSKKVTVFYAQSVSIVDYLIRHFGSAAFGRLCRNLQDGKTMEDAIKIAYSNMINSFSALERKWVYDMQK